MHRECFARQGDYIKKTLEDIVKLQREAVVGELREEMCDARTLGVFDNVNLKFNTRPVQVFTDDDEPWKTKVNRNDDGCHECEETCVFRVERVENGVAIFRALIHCEKGCMNEERREECREHKHCHRMFKSTDSFITIKLANIAALRCLRDTFVNLCIR